MRAPAQAALGQVEDGRPVHHRALVQEEALLPRGEGPQRPEREGDGPLVRGDHVQPAAEGLPHVGDRRLAAPRVEGRDLDEHVGGHAGDEGPHVAGRAGRGAARSSERPFATSRSARPRSIPRGSMAMPWRAVAMPVTRTRAPAAFRARA